ncbi:MAG: sortase [Candidatus Nanopelagicales bacterium]|jgi:sortase A|nr:sortase [Candidatus Nanopelagicales bacterium]MDP4715876.1 sortase [Candidatus Nanopelagicales bacterium]MDP4907325.1 sortase [Candidatus Nanopelagicales bacterium]MDP4974655.1 sortase [Candidatus Nanopelagicales bacterium]
MISLDDSLASTPPGSGDTKDPAPRFMDSPMFLVASVLLIFSCLCLGFLANLLVVSQLIHARDQEVLYSDFRSELANAIAPVGQTDINGALLQPGAAIAILEIPDIGLQEVVVEGTTSTVTQSGPGHKRDTVLPGQAGTSVIYGRQAAFGGPFGQVEILQPGMTIVATTGQGVAEYRVIGVRRPGDPIPALLQSGEGRLTLVTAMGPRFMPTDLLRVDAELVSQVQPSPPRVITPASMDPAEQAMAGDPEGLVPLLLWLQVLLAVAVATVWLVLRWGKWQAWLVAAPIFFFAGVMASMSAIRLLPNLL